MDQNILALQMLLNEAGFNAGPEDGLAGKRTAAAVDAYLAAHGPVATGKMDDRSEKHLIGVKEPLARVMRRAFELSGGKMMVIEGLRTPERQKVLLAQGATTTLNSRHLTGHAVDVVPLDDKGQIRWDWPLYYKLEKIIKQAAKDVGVKIEWGGDWESFKDGPHWQLPR